VVGGIAFSTLLTLFVVPCAYVVLHGIGDRVRATLVGRRRQTPALGPELPGPAGD
jgi:hypothetical protein